MSEFSGFMGEAFAPEIEAKPAEPAPAAPVVNITTGAAAALAPSAIWQECERLTHADYIDTSCRSKDDDTKKAVNCYMLAMLGRRYGLDPVSSLFAFSVVNGRPALNAKTKLAIVRKAGGKVQVGFDEERGEAWCEVTRHDNGDSIRATFSIGEAVLMKKMYYDPAAKAYAGTSNSAWGAHWPQMLRWRAIGRACDMAYADLLVGVSTVEDLQDATAQVEIRPQTVRHAANSANVSPLASAAAHGDELKQIIKK